ERALEERDAVEPAQVDGADLAIVVELERPVDVRRPPERHADRAHARTHRPLAPPALARLRQEAFKRLLARDDARLSRAPPNRTPRGQPPSARDSPRHEGQEGASTVSARHHFQDRTLSRGPQRAEPRPRRGPDARGSRGPPRPGAGPRTLSG